MRVQFVGVGEAFDETLPNNSQILEWPGCRLLIDCGYAVPHFLWKLHPDPNYVDAIYLSHRHADHYFGLPSYLLRLAEEKRLKPVEIICGEELKEVVLEMIDFAYQGLLKHFPFQTVFHPVAEGVPFGYRSARMEFAVSSHPVKNLAIAVLHADQKYCYSGDGNFNEHTRALYRNATMLVHEAYSFDRDVRGHARADQILQMAKEENIKVVALTHLQRDVRKTRLNDIAKLAANQNVRSFIPEPGEEHNL